MNYEPAIATLAVRLGEWCKSPPRSRGVKKAKPDVAVEEAWYRIADAERHLRKTVPRHSLLLSAGQ